MICVLGDAHLDVVVRVSGPVAEETDTPAQTLVGAGGQAANVAAWIAELGGQARLIAARASDPAADLVAAELIRRGVDLAGPELKGRTGVVVSLSDHGRARSMLTDRGVGPQLTAAAVDANWLAGCAWLTCPPIAWFPGRSGRRPWPRPAGSRAAAWTYRPPRPWRPPGWGGSGNSRRSWRRMSSSAPRRKPAWSVTSPAPKWW
jgi:hypothetical protein